MGGFWRAAEFALEGARRGAYTVCEERPPLKPKEGLDGTPAE